MKNQKLNHILFWVIVFVLAFAISSCSAKKKSHQSDVAEIKAEHSQNSQNSNNSDTNVKLDIKTKVDDKTKTVSTAKTWTPVDATKPASMTDPEGKKHELNNTVYKEETTTENKDTKTDNSDNSQAFQKNNAAGKAESKGSTATKNEVVDDSLDKSGFNFWSWLWMAGLILVVILLLYLNNRFKLIKRVTTFFSK